MSSKSGYRPAELLRDHARPRQKPAISDAAMEARLEELISPATYALMDQYRRLGLRQRVLTLPVMVCLLLAIVWRQLPGVGTAVEVFSRERLLWIPPIRVSQQAISERLRTLPALLFRDLVNQLLPTLHERAAARTRPVPAVLGRVGHHFAQIWAADATTLESLFKKMELLREEPGTVLGGKLAALLDLRTKLPVAIWWDQDAAVNERSFLRQIQAMLPPRTLLTLDRGFFGFALFDWFTEHEVFFLMPDRQHTAFQVVETLEERPGVLDQVVKFGKHRSNPCTHPVRRIVVQIGDKHRVYLTNVLDPRQITPIDAVDLYDRRWRIEDAFSQVKRLLGLSYLWTGSGNGIQLQVWTSWLLYAVLIDLCDDIADRLQVTIDQISVEKVFRGLYHFTVAYHRGDTDDPVAYLAAQSDLGIVKRRRKSRERLRLAQRALLLNL